MAAQQPLFDKGFETLTPATPVYCHQEFLEKLESYRNHPIAKRASLLMQRLAVDERRQHYKSTHGVNQGWRRSRLGGGGGSHFYAWWAPKTAAPMKSGGGFQDAPEGAIFLRDIRHHDDHSEANPNSFADHYLPVSVEEMRREDYAPAPWTPQQVRFASSRSPVRILKGYPGSGKTTALLNAADSCGAERILYLTYSRDLAVLAREYFEKYCSKAKQYHVLTYDTFLRQLLGVDLPKSDYAELRKRFRGDLVPFSRSLGPWTDRIPALYDEMHAHMVGAAIPVEAGRFHAARQARTEDRDYKQRRFRYLGEGAASAVVDLASKLERSGTPIAERYFPELALAWRAASGLTAGGPKISPEFLNFDCIAVDEVQDLTPVEAFVMVELAAVIARSRRGKVPVFVAGDEAQTVRPSDFEWAWMNDLLHSRLGTPAEFKLAANLRSPHGIAVLVNEVWSLYEEIEKRDRPSGSGYAEIDDDATDQVMYCCGSKGAEMDQLLIDLAGREGLAIVSYDDSALESVPESIRRAILKPSEVKGLDFHTVCLLNAGEHLDRITRWRYEPMLHVSEIESIRRRLAIDELRVGISRPADRLIWLDIDPSNQAAMATARFLSRGYRSMVAPSIPSALLTTLSEEQLDVEERIQRCQADARQYLEIRPEMAWSRARQAVMLLGDRDNAAAVQDISVRRAAQNTLAEICFCLGFRRVRLPVLRRLDLLSEAALEAPTEGLRMIIQDIYLVMNPDNSGRLQALVRLVNSLVVHRERIETWLLAEIEPQIPVWLDELEASLPVGDNALTLAKMLPPLYETLRLPDAAERKERLIQQSIRHLLKHKRHEAALEILTTLPERNMSVEAECLAAVGRHAEAAGLYRSVGMLNEALASYREIPDFEAAAALIREIPGHPASQAYEWLIKLRQFMEERPANLNRTMTAAEKKILEELLSQGLGVTRKTPVKKAAVKKAATKKAAVKKTAVKKTARPKWPRV